MRNDNLRRYCVTLLLIYCVGCATLARHSPRVQENLSNRHRHRTVTVVPIRDSNNPEIVYSYVLIEDKSYLDNINEQAKRSRQQKRWNQKRHIGFFGFLKRTEKEVGVKVVFPF